MPDPRPVRIPIKDIDTVSVLRQALVRHDAMKRASTAYRTTTLRMQDVGLLGEHAVMHWLCQRQPRIVEHVADDDYSRRNGSGDIAIHRQEAITPGLWQGGSLTFEVKTGRYPDWKRYGRSLDAAQLARSNASAYIWCVVAPELPTESVLLMGWLPTETMRTPEAGVPVREHDRPHWRVTAPMRPINELPAWCDNIPIAQF